MNEKEWWLAPLGAGLTLLILASFLLVAAGGWEWFAGFLTGQASGWAQAFGSIAAILAAYKMGRHQIEADRLLEASRRAAEDSRRLMIIDAMLANVGTSLSPLIEKLPQDRIPVRYFCVVDHLAHTCKVVKSIDLFQCPSPEVATELAYLPTILDHLFIAIEQYDKSFDDYKGDVMKGHIGLQNSLTVTSMYIDRARKACRKALAELQAAHE
ncbi:hypothetical protein [Roseateles sp. PN1]|uniref:hypothetical protein n=1 Tax=Roseateles sp. PN1 TaxID=3137372 RepID=UPI00313A1D20